MPRVCVCVWLEVLRAFSANTNRRTEAALPQPHWSGLQSPSGSICRKPRSDLSSDIVFRALSADRSMRSPSSDFSHTLGMATATRSLTLEMWAFPVVPLCGALGSQARRAAVCASAERRGRSARGRVPAEQEDLEVTFSDLSDPHAPRKPQVPQGKVYLVGRALISGAPHSLLQPHSARPWSLCSRRPELFV